MAMYPTFLISAFLIFYLAPVVIVFYIIYRWVSKFIALRQEQNFLLREILKKMEERQSNI